MEVAIGALYGCSEPVEAQEVIRKYETDDTTYLHYCIVLLTTER